ncbi:MAG: YjbH domain-containing protein [Prevotella sp.]|nr:YjbH domain-containing protein [Prevotella sp.]
MRLTYFFNCNETLVKQYCSTILCFVTCIPINAQTVIGTNGMMNVPTADMRPAGTFDGGASLIQKELLYDKHYYTGLFYVTFTPFSWMELTFRETIREYQYSLKRNGKTGPFTNLDRSVSARIRPLKEGKYWPSVVLGANDFYSEGSGSSNFYACYYGVLSKHFPIQAVGTFETTVGYARPYKKGIAYDGVMGGLSFAPDFFPDMRVMGEYDTHGYNVGIGAFLFRHLNVTCFTREFKGINATLSYQYTISY